MTERCQLQNVLTRLTFRGRVRLLRNRLALRTRLRRVLSGKKPSATRVGKPSAFAAGTWVRVRDGDSILRTLDGENKLRGLAFVEQMWPYCGTVHQVMRPVRRLMDDFGNVRPMHGTVLLQTPCSGVDGNAGCGRECPLWYRDEWLEPAPAPSPATHEPCTPPAAELFATVRSSAEIDRTLDRRGKHGGLMFMPQMYECEGRRFRVLKKLETVRQGSELMPVAEPIYILEGLYCSGTVLGAEGPCDRGCSLLWHADWLDLSQG